MPTGIAASDRKLLIIGGIILLVLLVGISILTPPSDTYSSPVPSTYSSQSGGAKAAYRLLTNLKYPVRRWESPPTELDIPAPNILLVLADPIQPPSKGERKALADFVEDGGHVLFTGANIKDYFADAELPKENADPKFETLRPTLPSRIARNARSIVMQPHAHWGKMAPDQLSLYGATDASAVVSWTKGRGEILWWAASTPLTNAGLTRENNLTFFLNSVGTWEANHPYRIYWDEYFHGQRSSLWSYVAKTSLSWCVVQIAVLALAVLFTFSRRSGPIYVPVQTSRLSPLEFVHTLGGLYERAGAASLAVSVSYARLRTLLTRQLNLPANTRNAELAASAEHRLGWEDSRLGELLHRAATMTTTAKLPPGEALKAVQELEQFADKLKVRTQIQRGKA
jgi:Domain of unknown function (DUF4350)